MQKTYEQKRWEYALSNHKRYKKHLKGSVIHEFPSLKNYFETQIEVIEQQYPSLRGVTYD